MSYSIAEDISPTLDKDFERTKGRLYFESHAGYLGAILGNYAFQWTRDIPTACISPTTLYWNPDFYESLCNKTKVTVLAHELWHPGLLHHVAIGDRDKYIYNVAGDYVINNFLKQNKYYMDGFPFLLDDIFEDSTKWGTIEVYDYLIKNTQKVPVIGKNSLISLSNDVEQGDGTEAETAEAVKLASAARAMSKLTSTQPGKMPQEIDRLIHSYYNSKVPWEQALMNYFSAKIDPVRSYTRINRRYDDFLLPSYTDNEGLENLLFSADASGSITKEQINIFFSEGKFIHDVLGPEKMLFMTFDTEVHDIFEIDKHDEFEDFTIKGGGGTDLEDLFKVAKEYNPTCLVIFTDLEVDFPPDPGFEIIWIVIDNKNAEVPYGTLYKFEQSQWTN